MLVQGLVAAQTKQVKARARHETPSRNQTEVETAWAETTKQEDNTEQRKQGMKVSSWGQLIRGSRAIRLLAVGVMAVGISSAAWAKPPPHAMNDGFKFGVIGDHRGDNKASNVNSTKDGYKDGGINRAVLANLAAALRQEGVDFVLDVGDLATKWTTPMINITPDALMNRELADWAAIWNANSTALPIFPVRGN